MWLFTETGFLSAVRKGHGDQNLVVRARNIDALKGLSEFAQTAVVRTPKADYPFRLHLTPATWGEYVKTVALAVNYRNFKSHVKETLGLDHADVLGLIWKTMLAVQDENARQPLTTEYLEQPVDHYFYEVWSPNGECVSDGVCSKEELPLLRRNVEAEWLELVVWPQPKFLGSEVETSHISEKPRTPLVGAQWLPLIRVLAEMLQGLQCDPERFVRVDFYSDRYCHPIYVQAKQFENGTLTIEAISNNYLKTKLTNEQHQAMEFIGWELKDTNYCATVESNVALNLIAEHILNTMILVYQIDETCLFSFSPHLPRYTPSNFGLVKLTQNPNLFRLG